MLRSSRSARSSPAGRHDGKRRTCSFGAVPSYTIPVWPALPPDMARRNAGGVMANRQEIESTYDWLARFQALRLGRLGDNTAEFFDGDVRQTLDQARADKHAWVFEGLGVGGADKRVLDIGC